MNPEPDQVFKELKQSSAYNPTVPEEIKLQILRDSWGAICALKEKSDTEGMSVFGEENEPSDNFGFIAEAIAACDPDLPHNSIRAEGLAGVMLDAMRNGRHELIKEHRGRLYNPDFIWIKFEDGKAIVWGIGEVKSSGSAFVAGRDKMFLHENSLKKITEAMTQEVVLGDPLQKILIVPYCMKKGNFLLPDGWDVGNIKFTYNELLFIAKQIWPNFRPRLHFEKIPLGKDKYDFLDWFLKWGETKLRKIVPSSAGMINFKKLFLFICVSGKLPVAADMQLSASVVNDGLLERLYSYPANILEECEWKEWDQKFFKKFSAVVGVADDQEELQEQMKIFLTNFRTFSASLSRVCRGNKIMEELLQRANPFNIMVFKV